MVIIMKIERVKLFAQRHCLNIYCQKLINTKIGLFTDRMQSVNFPCHGKLISKCIGSSLFQSKQKQTKACLSREEWTLNGVVIIKLLTSFLAIVQPCQAHSTVSSVSGGYRSEHDAVTRWSLVTGADQVPGTLWGGAPGYYCLSFPLFTLDILR